MHEYRQSLDKKRFINDKQKQCSAILQVCWTFSLSFIFLSTFQQHAEKCETWRNQRESDRKNEQRERQLERGKRFAPFLPVMIFILSWRRIFERLEQHGYSREIGYFGHSAIEQSRDSDFRPPKPLTDKGNLPSIGFTSNWR